MADVKLDGQAIETAVAYGKQLSKPEPITSEKIHFAAVPVGVTITSLKDFQYPYGLPPERIKAGPRFQDAKSFTGYLNTFKDSNLRVFADANNVLFHGILDYHKPGDAGTEVNPGFCQHQAFWTMALSPQWQVWFGQNDKPIAQDAFAEFLEDNYRDIADPSPAIMLEVARELKATTEMSFESKITPKTGAVQLSYREDVKNAGSMEVPDSFKIEIPVFFGEAPVTIECRLRFRIRDGKLTFTYKMYRPTEVKLEAFKFAVGAVSEALGVDVLLGVA